MKITGTGWTKNSLLRYWSYFFVCFIFSGCSPAGDKGWQQNNIMVSMHRIFPSDSVFLLDLAAGVADKKDSIALPLPHYKALVKEKNATGYTFLFYFYDSSPKDTAVFLPLMRSIMIHDFKTGLGTKEPDYLLTMPFFDSAGANKMMVIALNAFTTKDSAYLADKQREILTSFALKSISTKPALTKSPLQ